MKKSYLNQTKNKKKDKKIKARDTMSNISNKDARSNKDDKKSENIKSEIDTKRKRKKGN